MTKKLIIGIDWYGPYSREEAQKAAEDFVEGGLYFAIGKPKGKGNHSKRPQYMGISKENLVQRATSSQHHVMYKLDYTNGLWLGEIATAAPSGKRQAATPATLRYGEWLHVLFMDLPKNIRLKKIPPTPVTVLNRWWRKDFDTAHGKRPEKNWPDLIEYLGPEHQARMVWFGSPGKLVKRRPQDFKRKLQH